MTGSAPSHSFVDALKGTDQMVLLNQTFPKCLLTRGKDKRVTAQSSRIKLAQLLISLELWVPTRFE